MDDKIYVEYSRHDGKISVRSRYQWDHGVQIAISGVPTDGLTYIEFANEHMTESVKTETIKDESGTISCMIPDSLFMMPYTIICYVIMSDTDSMITTMSIVIPVIARPRPTDYTCSPDEVVRFSDLLSKLNLSIKEVGELKKSVETSIGNADTATQNANEAASKINNMTVSAETLDQGLDASVEKTDDGKKISLQFGIPRGERGDVGKTPDIKVNVTTGEPGTYAAVVQEGTSEYPILNFTIPRGNSGIDGRDGEKGDTGSSGVYIGSDEPTDPDVNVWIDPEGDPSFKSVCSVNGVKADDSGNVQLSANNVGALPNDGTAEDSRKLGGKLPEYYGCHFNWLDNSDMTNAVNQRGASSYTGQLYGIDRWRGRAVAQTVSVRSADVTVTATGTSYAGIKQKVHGMPRLAGKTVTFAARLYANVVPELVLFDSSEQSLAVKMGTAGATQTLVLTYAVPADATADSVVPTILIRTSASGDYMRIVWAALYEGAYTTETLPPYTPKGYAAELAECRRYYQTIPALTHIPGVTNTSVSFGAKYEIPTMRIAPTVSIASGQEVSIYTDDYSVSTTNYTMQYAAMPNQMILNLSFDAGSFVAYKPGILIFPVEIALSADL